MDTVASTWAAWGADLPRLVLTVAVVFLPGVIGARLLGIRGVLQVGVGPLFTASTAALGSVICGTLGVGWGAPALAACLAVMLGACAAAGHLLGASTFHMPTRTRRDRLAGGRGPAAVRPAPEVASGLWTPALVAAVVLAWAAMVLPVMSQCTPTTPIQGHDTVFHMNALWRILVDGNASSFGGLTGMFGLDTTSTTFPAGWHALVAPLASRTTIVSAVNTFCLVVPLIWLTALAALAASFAPSRSMMPVLAVALAPLIVVFPTAMLTRYPAWPNALAMALVPALAALVVAAWTPVRLAARRRRAVAMAGISLAVLVVGLCLVHPLAGASLALLGAGPGLVLLGRRWARLIRARRSERVWTEVLVICGSAAVLAVVAVTVPFLREHLTRMVTAYQTVANTDWYNPLKALSLWSIVDDRAADRVWQCLLVAAVLVSILTVFGVIRALRTHSGRLLAAAWVVAAALTLTSLMRSGPLVPLAGVWYMSTYRTMAVQAVVQLPLMALGALAITDALAGVGRGAGARPSEAVGRPRSDSRGRPRRWAVGMLTAILLPLATGILTMPQREDLAWRMYSTDSPFPTVVLSDATVALAARAGELLPPDARVLGDPFNGSAYVQVLGDREAVFPQLYFRDSNTDLEYLRAHFREVGANPRVCQILQRDRIGYAWIDANPWHHGIDQSAVSPGLYDVDLREGFEVLDRAGTVTLVRITACR